MNNKHPSPEDFQDCEVFCLDYYDGPTSGAMLCQNGRKAYRFKMLDWDNKHDVRIFGLALLPIPSFRRFVHALFHPDPNADIEQNYSGLQQILDEAEEDEIILARGNLDDKVLAVKGATAQDKPDMVDWFLAPTLTKDWFDCLGLPRQR